MELKSVGGIYGGNIKPSPFLCLILKMLQIQPEKDIIIEFIRNEDFKYVRALGAFYMRLTGIAQDVYKYLEPLYIDYRKMKRMNKSAKYELIHMDEFIDELLHGERVCDVAMPRLQKRFVLEELNELEPRISPLEVNLDEDDVEESDESESESDGSDAEKKKKTSSSRRRDKEDDEKGRGDKSRGDKDRKPRGRYVDYDNPREEDLELYEKRRHRSRSPPAKHSSSSSRHKSAKHGSRDRSRERDRDRDHKSSKSKKKDKKHH